MKNHLDFYIGADINYLTNFIAYEQNLFAEYISLLTAKSE